MSVALLPHTASRSANDREDENFLLDDGLMSLDDVRHEQANREWQVEEIRDLTALTELRTTWNRLAAQTPNASHFLTFDWLRTYWEHNAADQELRVLAVGTREQGNSQKRKAVQTDSSTVIGIVPLVLRWEPTRLGRVRVMTFPLHGWGTQYGPLGSCSDLTMFHALRHIARSRREFDLLDLRWINNAGGLGDLTAAALRANGLGDRKQLWFETATVDLRDGWEAYWAGRTSHWRTNVRSNLKKLDKLGKVEYVRYRPRGAAVGEADPRWDLYEMCETTAAESWQGCRTDGTTLSHENVRGYLRAAHQTAVACGAADINLLLVGGRPAAFAYNYAQFDQIYGLRAGYAPEFKAAGAGSALMYHMLANSATRGDRMFDLGPGNLPSKSPWLTEIVPCWRYTHYSPWSWRAWGLKLKHKVARCSTS